MGIFTAPLMIKSNDSPLSLIVGSFPLFTLIKTVLSHNRNGSSPQHDEWEPQTICLGPGGLFREAPERGIHPLSMGRHVGYSSRADSSQRASPGAGSKKWRGPSMRFYNPAVVSGSFSNARSGPFRGALALSRLDLAAHFSRRRNYIFCNRHVLDSGDMCEWRGELDLSTICVVECSTSRGGTVWASIPGRSEIEFVILQPKWTRLSPVQSTFE